MKYAMIAAVGLLSALATVSAADVFNMDPGLTSVEFVTVGDPANVGDTDVMIEDGTSGYGRVVYTYQVATFEVTSAQYTEFLNAVAATDTYGLYNTNMWVDDHGCKIERSGSDGSYTYSVPADRANRPVTFVSWGDAARFANWLTNGQPTGAQAAATTEDGSYVLNGAMTDAELMTITRRPDAVYAMPTEDEWYKTAFYDGTSDVYYDYPTGSDTMPSNDLVDPDPGNSANYAAWNGTHGTYEYTVGAPYWTSEAGDFENSASPYGTFDMAGNVWEWNETATGPQWRGGRGGEALSDGAFMRAANWRSAATPSYEFWSLGFRVAEVTGADSDFDGDGDVDADDIDTLIDHFGDPAYDLNGDGDADEDDLVYLVAHLVQWSRPGGESGFGTQPGDANLDGLINATDLAVLQAGFGQPGGWASGNANTDALVDATDLAILAVNFGFTAPTAPVPEPATLLLMTAAGLPMLLKRRRSRC